MSDEKRALTVEDLTKLIDIEDPQLSPDGQWIAFVQVTPDMMERGYKRNIYVIASDGGQPVQLTRSGKDSQPRWSPDGKSLAFVSGRGDIPQIYVLPFRVPGGEARALTSNLNGASSPAWSPDGAHIAYLSGMNAEERAKEDEQREKGEAETPPKDKLEAKHRKERRDEDRKQFYDPLFVQRIPYRSGTRYLDDRHQQIYVIATDETLKGDEAKARRLTDFDGSYAPPSWSPDGETIYSARPIHTDIDEPWYYTLIHKIQVADGSETAIEDDHAVFGQIKPSPDGKWLACIRSDRVVEHLNRFSVVPTDGGDPIILNMGFDRSVYGYDWTSESQLIINVLNEGDVEIYQVNPETGDHTVLVDDVYAEMVSLAPDGGIAFTNATPENPSALYYLPKGGQRPTELTTFNTDFLQGVTVQPVHEMRFDTPSGTEIQGWYMLPVGYEDGKQYPLALHIHGGPHVMWSHATRSMWHEWQLHAARGYVVFFCNPRGSDGYGEAHQTALHAAWGTVAMEDIMAGVDALIAKGFVDETRMAITGGSYGGYMTAWIISHSDRFKAAVSQRGVYNLTSFYGTSDVPFLISNEYGVEPWQDHDLLWEHSPIAHAHKIKTPLLVIHSENDFRVPIEQGEQLFAYVRRSGGTAKLIRYPREGHELSRTGEPQHRISRLNEMTNWFDLHCAGQEN